MSHRTTDSDRERVHHARHPRHITDDNRNKTETAYREIVAGRYQGKSRSVAALDLPNDSTPSAATVAALAGELTRNAVVPDALAVACAAHDAEPGAYCFHGARGVCRYRLGRRRTDA